MNYHTTLQRQLKRSQLSLDELPVDLPSWQNFLEKINHSYLEFDQDRYTLERSQEIVSREMQILVDSLNKSQEIAHLGSWKRNFTTGQGTWSEETYRLFGRDPNLGVPTIDELYALISPEEREKFRLTCQNALKNGQSFNMELKILKNGEIRWFEVSGIPYREKREDVFIGLYGTYLDITKRKEIEAYTASLHQQLLSAARKAGMADIATSILHNIGNVLNSVNVLVSVLTEVVEKSELINFRKTIEILNTNKSALGTFFSNHPKGKYLLDYLNILVESWEKDKTVMISELSSLAKHVLHIKNIIATQQSISSSKGLIEKVELSSLLEESIMMAMASKENKDSIEIIRSYDYNIPIMVDKTKLSQVLINLIRNARDSVKEYSKNGQKIFIYSFLKDKDIFIEITDSGIGIEQDKITKIFTHGFTTKKEGHGFGLHMSALAMKEMGGELKVKSAGVGKGATFTLKLPVIN